MDPSAMCRIIYRRAKVEGPTMHARPRLYSVVLLAMPWMMQMMDNTTPMIPAAARVSCEIRANHDSSGGKLDAVILATGPIAGTFTFTVRKRGGGDVTSQSGDFKVDDASPAEIKKASIALASGEAYDASLEVKWPNGSSSCSSSVG